MCLAKSKEVTNNVSCMQKPLRRDDSVLEGVCGCVMCTLSEIGNGTANDTCRLHGSNENRC